MAEETIDRDDICRRHGLALRIAPDLHGATQAEMEADAAARAAIAQMFGASQPEEEQTEPPIGGMAPRDKEIADYSDTELAAQQQSLERIVRLRAEQAERERADEEFRLQAEAERTDDQRLGDAIRESAQPGAKAAAQRSFIASLHGSD